MTLFNTSSTLYKAYTLLPEGKFSQLTRIYGRNNTSSIRIFHTFYRKRLRIIYIVLTWNSSGESLTVLHQPLAQFMTADVGWPDEHDGPLVGRSRVVQSNLLVGQDLLTIILWNRNRRIKIAIGL